MSKGNVYTEIRAKGFPYYNEEIMYLEIISWRFGYRPKYQPETPLSAREL